MFFILVAKLHGNGIVEFRKRPQCCGHTGISGNFRMDNEGLTGVNTRKNICTFCGNGQTLWEALSPSLNVVLITDAYIGICVASGKVVHLKAGIAFATIFKLVSSRNKFRRIVAWFDDGKCHSDHFREYELVFENCLNDYIPGLYQVRAA